MTAPRLAPARDPGWLAVPFAVLAIVAAFAAMLVLAVPVAIAAAFGWLCRVLGDRLDRWDPPSGHHAAITPETPAAVSPCGVPEEAPVPPTAPPAGPGASPDGPPMWAPLWDHLASRRDTWVVYPPSGRHVTAAPRMVPVDNTVPLRRLPVRSTGRPPWGAATEPVCAAPDAPLRDEDDEALTMRTGRYMDEDWYLGRPSRFAARDAAIYDALTSPGWDFAQVRRAAATTTAAQMVIA